MINISELPENIKECYLKWKYVTEIDNLNSFFEDYFIETFDAFYIYDSVGLGIKYKNCIVAFCHTPAKESKEAVLWEMKYDSLQANSNFKLFSIKVDILYNNMQG